VEWTRNLSARAHPMRGAETVNAALSAGIRIGCNDFPPNPESVPGVEQARVRSAERMNW
jgi:hypothetical protein